MNVSVCLAPRFPLFRGDFPVIVGLAGCIKNNKNQVNQLACKLKGPNEYAYMETKKAYTVGQVRIKCRIKCLTHCHTRRLVLLRDGSPVNVGLTY